MRLAQLSRKLALRPAEIADFLAQQSIQIEEGSNTRLDDAHVTLILKHFAPAMLSQIEAELAAETPEELNLNTENTIPAQPVTEPVTDTMPAIPPLAIDTQPNQPVKQNDNTTPPPANTTAPVEPLPDVIRAPKVELPGLKVVGKIEIPQPRKKEATPKDADHLPPQEDTAPPAPNTQRKSYEDRRLTNKRKDDKPRRNPIAVQREREAMEADQKKREAAEREKERRTRNYLKKVTGSQPVKPARLVKEQVVDMSTELRDTPKTWWGKFKKWLTS